VQDDELDQYIGEEFKREVEFMEQMRHPNLLLFYGAGVNPFNKAFLVTEIMSNGSLKALLHNHTHPIDWATRVLFAIDIASGVAYLHSQGAIHRDLKADNCFVDDELRVKVADFGTSKTKQWMKSSDGHNGIKRWSQPDSEVSGAVGSFLWMAPEALTHAPVDGRNGPLLDVYSFAIVLWEIWARATPWAEVVEDAPAGFWATLKEKVASGERPAIPADTAPRGYRELMERCWNGRAAQRPFMADVVSHLRHIASDGRRDIYE